MSDSIYSFTANTSNGKKHSLSEHQGKVLLIVNTASKCGFTPQFEGLEKLYKSYQEQGLVVLGFPCNQFAKQDPADDLTIADFCQVNYGVSFPMFAKIDVNGADTHPLFAHLKSEAKGLAGTERVKWNFTKFLVGRDGKVIKRYAPTTKPEAIAADIEKALATE